MTTANSSALPLNPETGRAVVTLTSYSGPITWGTTPIAGDQIEYPAAISVNAAGEISGAGGTYTIRHIIASTGAVQAVSYVLTAGNSASTSINLNVDLANYGIVTLTSYVGSYNFAVTPVAGDQLIYPDAVTINSDGSFVGANATYTIYHVRQTGIIEAISYAHVGTNTAPTFGAISDVVANIGDAESFDISASDPDTGDILSYAADVLPRNGISLTGSVVSGTYTTEETFLCTFTVQDDSGDTGNDSDTAQVLFSIARAGYTITTLTVNYAGLNVDSPLIDVVAGDGDLTVGDQVDYPITATDFVGTTRNVSFASDGLMTVTGTRSIKVENIYFRDSSNSYNRVGPFAITLKGTGPTLTSPLEVVPNSPTTSGGQMRFTTDEGSASPNNAGDYRLIVIASGFGTPTRAQVMAGLGPDGNAPLFDSGLQVKGQAAGVSEVVTVTGLPTQGAGYWVFLALEDQYGGVTLEGPSVLTTIASGQPPVWSVVPDQTFNEGTPFSFDLSTYCTDFASFSISGLANGTTLSFNSATGVLSGTPTTVDASGEVGTTTTYSVIATAFNATGSSSTSFNIGFYRLNLPVNSVTIPNQSWQENISVSLSLNSFITNATTYELQIDGADATAELSGYGITFNSTTGTITGTPNNTAIANSPYTMRARGVNSDGNGAWQNFTTTIAASAPPVFAGPIPSQTFVEGQSISFSVSQYFTGASSYVLQGLPIGSNLVINNSGLITGIVNAIDVSSSPYNITVRASNTDGSVTGTFNATFTSAVVPVLIAGFPDLSFAVGTAVSITFANYIRNATSYNVVGIPDGSGLIVTATGIGGTFTQTDSNSAPFTVVVTGLNADGSVSDSFQVSTLAPSAFVNIFDPVAHFVKFYGDAYRSKTKSGSDNWSQIQLYNQGVAYLLNNVTDLECILDNGVSTYTLKRSSNSASFQIIPSEGKFNVRLGESSAPAGTYDLNIKYYDLNNPDGVLFTAYRDLIVEFV